MSRAKPRKGKAKVKVTASGKRVSYGQAGNAKGGGPRVKPGTSKGDSYCARSLGIKELDLQLLKDNELERFVRLFKVEQALRERI